MNLFPMLPLWGSDSLLGKSGCQIALTLGSFTMNCKLLSPLVFDDRVNYKLMASRAGTWGWLIWGGRTSSKSRAENVIFACSSHILQAVKSIGCIEVSVAICFTYKNSHVAVKINLIQWLISAWVYVILQTLSEQKQPLPASGGERKRTLESGLRSAARAAKRLKVESPKTPDKKKMAALLICHGKVSRLKTPQLVSKVPREVSDTSTGKERSYLLSYNNLQTQILCIAGLA